MSRLRWAVALCWLAALGARALAATDPGRVERLYSRGAYPRIAAGLAAVFGRLPFAAGELFLAGVVLAAVVWLLRFARRAPRPASRLGGVVHVAWVAAASLGPLYLAFLLLWGLNYQRLPMAESARLDARPAALDELESLCRRLAAEAEERRPATKEDARGVMRLEGGLASAIARIGAGFEAAARRHALLQGPLSPAKPVALSAGLSYLGISGVFCPFTGEPNVNATLPEAELPFVIAHETAHQRGIAREDEANYVASLACRLHPDPDYRYSGSLLASLHASAALRGRAPDLAERLGRSRSAAVRRDIAALQAWSERYRTPLRRVGEAVNDGYLRSQGQRDGVASYGRMVDLLIAEERARKAPGSAP